MGTTEKRIWSHKKIRTRSRNVHWIDVTSFSRKDQSNIDGFASLCILLVTFVGDFFLNYFASFSRFLLSRTWFRGAGGGCGIARRTAQVAQKCVFRAGSGPFRRLGLGGWFQRVILIDEEQKKTSSFEAFFWLFKRFRLTFSEWEWRWRRRQAQGDGLGGSRGSARSGGSTGSAGSAGSSGRRRYEPGGRRLAGRRRADIYEDFQSKKRLDKGNWNQCQVH